MTEVSDDFDDGVAVRIRDNNVASPHGAAQTTSAAKPENRIAVILSDEDVVLGLPGEAVVLERDCALITFDIATSWVAAKDRGSLDIIAVVPQVLPIHHVVTGLVLGVDRRRVEWVDEVHRGKKQTVAPRQGLPPYPDHGLFAGIAKPEAIEPVQQCAV